MARYVIEEEPLGRYILEADESASRAQMSHPAVVQSPKDLYTQQAQSQSFSENLLSGIGGALYGVGNLGPRSIVGAVQPGEVADWKASMSGLGKTGGGTIGQIAGYAGPGAVMAPFAGASVPLAGAIGLVEGALMPAESMSERGKNALFSGLGATVGQAGGNVVAKGMTARAAKKKAEMQTKKAQNVVRDATLAASKKEGYVVPPSYSGGPLWSRFMEGVSGKYKTNQLAGIKNQEVTNNLVRKELGLPENSPLTDSALDAYRAGVSAPYREVANLPKRNNVKAASNFTDWDYPVQEVSGFDPAKALQDLKEARFNAKMYWRGANMGNPEALQLAKSTDAIADSIEAQIEQYATENGSHDLVQRLVEARKKNAQSYTVENALNEGTGDVDATKLAKMIEKDDPLSGEIEKAGRFGMAFHDVARPPKSGDANPVTALDFLSSVPAAGLGALAWGGPGAMALTLAPAGLRIGSRYSLLSRPVQSLVNPNYSIGLLNRTAPQLLNNQVSNALYKGAGIYGYGVAPFAEQ